MSFMLGLLVSVFALTACSSDDDNDGDVPSALVSNDMPKTDGWNGDLQNGISTYVPYLAEDEDDFQPRYAFDFKDGTCQNAVFSLICPNEYIAKEMARMFQDGTWLSELGEDKDEDDYYDEYYGARAKASIRKMQTHLKAVTRAATDYNPEDLKMPVLYSGKVLYITVDCLKGKRGNTLKAIVIFWQTGEGTPEIVMGKWDDAANRYTCGNLLGLGINYEINTAFESDSLTNYVTEMTFLNKSWANMIFEQLEEQNQEIEAKVKLRPKATLNGKTVKEEAVILGRVTKAETLEIIAMLDWLMARPFFTAFAD